MQEPVATTSNDEEDDRLDALEQAARSVPHQNGQLDLSLSLQFICILHTTGDTLLLLFTRVLGPNGDYELISYSIRHRFSFI